MAKQELRLPDDLKESLIKYSRGRKWSQNTYIIYALEQQITRDRISNYEQQNNKGVNAQ